MSEKPRDDQPQARWLGWIEISLLTAAIMVPLELGALRQVEGVTDPDPIAPGLSWTTVTLMLTLAMVIGAIIETSLVFARRFPSHLRPWVVCAGTLLVSVPTATSLFDGSFAATLPGAATAPYWLPLLTWAATGGVILGANKLLERRPALRPLMVIGLVVLAMATEIANRNVKTSELFDLHTALIVAAMVATYLAIRLRWRPPTTAPKRSLRILRITVGVACAVNFVLVLDRGLDDSDARRQLSSRGNHSRLLVRVVRAALDGDADGYSAWLGGADCDDSDPDRHPGVPEQPGNDVDENCDGFVAPAGSERAEQSDEDRERGRARARWLEDPGVLGFVGETQQMNVLVVSVDALRADMLEDTAQNREQFPALFELLDASLHFEHAYAPAAGTDIALSTFLTGHIDSFAATDQTLPEAMSSAGYRTYAVLPSEVMRYAGASLLTRGLDGKHKVINDLYEKDVGSYSTSKRTTKRGLAYLDGLRAESSQDGTSITEAAGELPKFWLWLHYFDVHEHDEISGSDKGLRGLTTAEQRKDRRLRYRATVALVDVAVADLITGLKQRGLWDSTIILFLSDHGEGLGEDPRLPDNHGLVLYEPLVRVPLALRVPGGRVGVSSTPVTFVDLMPTMIALTGGTAPEHLDGRNLLSALAPEGVAAEPTPEIPPRPIALNETEQRGVVAWPYKLLWRPDDNLFELYDLEQDPHEQDDLSEVLPEVLEDMLTTLSALPQIEIDRTARGRRQRERTAREQPSPP